jgi:hypothetical protein
MRDRKGMLTEFLAERMRSGLCEGVGRPWIETGGQGAGFASRLCRLGDEADRSVRAPFDASLRGFDVLGMRQGLRMNIESIERFAKEGTAAGAKQSLAFDGYLGGF